jgi:hypothetical protein
VEKARREPGRGESAKVKEPLSHVSDKDGVMATSGSWIEWRRGAKTPSDAVSDWNNCALAQSTPIFHSDGARRLGWSLEQAEVFSTRRMVTAKSLSPFLDGKPKGSGIRVTEINILSEIGLARILSNKCEEIISMSADGRRKRNLMRTLKVSYLTLGLALALALAFSAPSAKAQISNQATQVTFEQSVRVPGRVLAPGTYWFTVADAGPNGDLNEVQIKNADGTKVIDQVQTANAAVAQEGQTAKANGVTWPSGKIVLIFAQGRTGEPITLLDWYYPGRREGHRFVYTDREEKQIKEEQHKTLAFKPGETITVGRNLASFE